MYMSNAHTPRPHPVCLQGARIPAIPLVLGEFGMKDAGDNSINNTDTTSYSQQDRVWIKDVADYLRALAQSDGAVAGGSSTSSSQERAVATAASSWLWWAWNANAGGAKGVMHYES